MDRAGPRAVRVYGRHFRLPVLQRAPVSEHLGKGCQCGCRDRIDNNGLFCGGSDGLIVVLLLALLLASVCNSGRILRLLSLSPLIWVGEISYSLYIFQKIPLVLAVLLSGWLVTHGYGGAWLPLLAILLPLGCGALVHRYVDVPARAGLRLLPDRVMAFAAGSRSALTTPLPPISTAAPKRNL